MSTASQRLIDAQFTRNPAFSGVELRVVNGQREWGLFSQCYQVLFSNGWRGKVWHQRRQFEFGPGSVIIAAPGQLILTKKAVPGLLSCLSIERSLLETLEVAGQRPLGTGYAMLSEPTANALEVLIQTLRHSACPEELERSTLAAIDALSEREAKLAALPEVRALGPAAVHPFDDDSDIAFDLRSLSEQLGTSRFSALRAFKRHFGLPPHNYQIHLRVEQAQTGLRAGHSPARVAVDCGFFDQSHMTRHFKRVLGTTPAQYARAWTPGMALALPQ